MPFKKVGPNDYTSPSGRHFNQAQVRLYYAGDGFPGQKKVEGGPVARIKPKEGQREYCKGGRVR